MNISSVLHIEIYSEILPKRRARPVRALHGHYRILHVCFASDPFPPCVVEIPQTAWLSYPPSHLCRCSWFSCRVVFAPGAPPLLYSLCSTLIFQRGRRRLRTHADVCIFSRLCLASRNVFTRPEALVFISLVLLLLLLPVVFLSPASCCSVLSASPEPRQLCSVSICVQRYFSYICPWLCFSWSK